MSLLLASVSNLDEARLALACGVDWLDIKDPHAGALGRAASGVVSAIARSAGGRLPVSATVGDTWDTPAAIGAAVADMAATGVDYIKVGLRARAIGPAALAALISAVASGTPLIVVCMAEDPPAICDLEALAATGIAGVMLDTADKAGGRLTALLTVERLRTFVECGRRLGLLTGLAGRLQLDDVPILLPCMADYLGFRSALCHDGQREAGFARDALLAVRSAVSGGVRRVTNIDNEVA